MNIQDRLKQGPIPAGEALDYILQELAAPSADVYSLGMTLGEMVTGTRPFQADPKLPADTRRWAALQQVGGGTWGGCVFDVEAILARLGGH